MRVKDEAYSVYSALTALPWLPSYLAAMWILCGELRALYADWINDDEVPLLAATMELVREVAIAGESSQAAARAAELAVAWRHVIAARRAEASGALLNALATFKGLTQEIAGIGARHDAASWATNAAEDRWRDLDDPATIFVNPDEEVDEASPVAQTLILFRRVASTVASWPGPEWDPARIRPQIFGQQ